MVAYARADHRADRATHAPIVTDADNRPPLITGGTPEAEIISELAPRPGEYLVPKHRWSAFHGTYLDTALRTRGANLVIAADACTRPKREVHEQLMREVFPRLARVRATAQVLEMLRAA